MSMWARLKGLVGGEGFVRDKTVAVATTTYVPDDLAVVHLTGTATITSLTADPATRGRFVWFRQSDTGATTFTNSPGSTTAGQMDLGGLDSSNVVLGQTDWLHLYLRADMVWERVTAATNN